MNEKLKELCAIQTKLDREEWAHRDADHENKKAMEAEFKPLQRVWRRLMKKAAGDHGFFISPPIIWALIDHSKRPVGVTPIASAEIHLKGVKLDISCRAELGDMEVWADRAARAFAILSEGEK